MKKILFLFAALFIAMMATVYTASAQTTAPTATQHLKKDGTPDKRFKSKATGPVKKDGTPDMRYKANNPNAGNKKKK